MVFGISRHNYAQQAECNWVRTLPQIPLLWFGQTDKLDSVITLYFGTGPLSSMTKGYPSRSPSRSGYYPNLKLQSSRGCT
ncbi:hypothetical protein PM082_019945 [Marasmius tenuissimus]|nr:hypothetical protein PM082_019945 [Marasmius tenuissimus]